jgi:hypothetical protein
VQIRKHKDYRVNELAEFIEHLQDVKYHIKPFEMAENNSKLSIWTTVLGEGLNEHNLRSYAPIKTRVRRPNPMEFHMKY